MIKVADKWGDTLITRNTGEELRKEVEKVIAEDGLAILDFSNVIVASHSFSDEAFGKLAKSLSLEKFVKQIKFVNVDSDTSVVIKYVIAQRLEGKSKIIGVH